ncbi:hypothetical protein Taro_041374 [Colocasia esculenta]|uniref:MAG2-interacting protein 2 n=1 Tax=Colocasia esculenta TaxID=4460 RepID=A0A843WTC3_COLES|nr:hypothetical protein [Colocasia esculenta]
MSCEDPCISWRPFEGVLLEFRLCKGLALPLARVFGVIWKARECLNLFPNSDIVKAEAGVIDALATKLPNLGVTLLPMQFRQIRNPMEVITMVIKNQSGAYLNIDGLIEIARLLGLNSPDDIASIQEAVAREAAVTGDLQVAFDLCLILSKKGHGPIWDLCAAIAKGPALQNVDTSARKQLLGFSLSHCDEESIGELLYAWKDINMQACCEKLMSATGTSPSESTFEESSLVSLPAHDIADVGQTASLKGDIFDGWSDYQEDYFVDIKNILSTIAKDIPSEILRNNWKNLSFAALNLPWLIKLSKVESGKKASLSKHSFAVNWHMPVRMQAVLCILSWLAMNDISPNDDVIASLAKSVMETSTSEEEDVLGCTFLLNLMDAFHGVEIIEEQTKNRQDFHELNCIMNLGVIYSSLHSAGIGCSDPEQRRLLLLHKFQEKHASFCPGEIDNDDKAQSAFWTAWRSKLEEQKRLAAQSRKIEDLIPGADASRFLCGDTKYIEEVIFSLVNSVKSEKRHVLKDAIELADTYHVQRAEVSLSLSLSYFPHDSATLCNSLLTEIRSCLVTEISVYCMTAKVLSQPWKVLLRYLGCALVSELWTNDEILAEVLDYKEELIGSAKGVISVIYSFVYPEIDGRNKQRLSYVYSILSACYLRLKRTEEPVATMSEYLGHPHTTDITQFYKLLEQECQRVSFIRELNFKKIAGLVDLDFEHFNEEVRNHISEYSVSALAEMVQNLLSLYNDSADRGLISCQSVYKYHILSNLETLDTRRQSCMNLSDSQEFSGELEANYESCRIYIRALPEEDILNTVGRYCSLCLPHNFSETQSDESASKPCLVTLLNFWIKVAGDIQEFLGSEVCKGKSNSSNGERLSNCLQALRRLIMMDEVSRDQGWRIVSVYAKLNLPSGLVADISSLYKAMAFSGCYFNTIFEIFSEQEPTSADHIEDISQFYVNTIDAILLKLDGNNYDRRNLLNMLSSLSKLQSTDGKLINTVRYGVWRKLIAYSDNLQISNHIRMYALQMMEAITRKNIKNLPIELASDLQPWEEWEGSCTETDGAHNPGDVFSRVTSTLVALKSTQLSAVISPMVEITSEDLKTIESAICCFLRLSEFSTSELHVNTLQAILEEWEELFIDGSDGKCSDMVEERNDWSDEWDEGWENFPEELRMREGKQIASSSIHPFHTCWMEIIIKLVGLSQLRGVMQLFDRSLSKSQGILLSETEAQSLFQLVVGVDCFMGLKIVLLLPYRTLWFQALSIIEEKLKQEDTPEMASADEELLPLLISTGILPSIATDSSYQKVFSYLCCSVGHLCRLSQENILKHRDDGRKVANEDGFSLYIRVLFPLFVSELSKAGQFLLAGLIVTQWMHTHSSFSLINVVDLSLRKYLEAQLQTQHLVEYLEELGSCKSLAFTVSNLRGKFGDSIQSALSLLSSDMK